MKVIYLASPEEGAGKTALAGALAKAFSSTGQSAGYFKPLRLVAPEDSPAPDEDAGFLKEALQLSSSAEELCPLRITENRLQEDTSPEGLLAQLEGALARVAGTQEVCLVEGVSGHLPFSRQLAQKLGARVVLVTRYHRGIAPTEIAQTATIFGDSLLGIVLNAVPALSQRQVNSEVIPFLKNQGLQVLGVIPEDRLLLGPTVREIAEWLEAKILLESEQLDEIVEHFLVGALTLDSAVLYFERKQNKAVITRGDKPDIQWCALETPTRCLVLTCNLQTIAYVMERAKALGVPILLTEKDSLTTLAVLETSLAKAHVHHPRKMERFQGLIQQHLDLAPLQVALRPGA